VRPPGRQLRLPALESRPSLAPTRRPSSSRSAREPGIDKGKAIEVAAFRGALREFLRKSEKIARANGLTPQRHLLLLMIKGAPDGSESATISDLMARLQFAQSTVTELVKRAEAVGLVERQQSEVDGRFVHLRLTAEGERRLARVF
jgi:DNA-binding MarR family transcriptional regulator